MWIRRLTVANWRGLDQELTDLAPGLNLVFGPNESGKSRLVEALRFALFESSSGRSAHKKALATWGLAPGKPRVAVEFELGGVAWQLEKVFLGTGHNTVLSSGAGRLEGADAEAQLAELLGVGQSGRTELKAEDRGIWSLLWVDQGASRDAPEHNAISQSRIHDHLTREIGEVAAGELGRQILRRAEEQRSRYYTSSRDAERVILIEAREQAEHLQRRLDDAVARRAEIADAAEELDRQRAAERDLTVRVDKAAQRLGDVRGRHEQAIELARRVDVSEEQVRTAESKRDQALQNLQAVRSLDTEIAELARQADEAERARAQAEADREAAQRALDGASAAAAEADRQYAEQERAVLALRRRHEATAMLERTEVLQRRLAAAADVNGQIAGIAQELARLPEIDADVLERLRAAEELHRSARARLEGASASVELTAHRDLHVDGEALASGAVRRMLVEDEQRFEVDGVASITVCPGGGELPKLRDAARDAERVHARLLESLSVRDAAEARQAAERRTELNHRLERCRSELKHHLPDGRDAAETELRELEARLSVVEAPGERIEAGELEAAEDRLRELAARRDELRARREVVVEALSAARENAASRNAELESRQRQLVAAKARRQSLPDVAALENAYDEAERSWRERVAVRDEMEHRFEAVGGDDIQLDLDQAENAWEQLGSELQQVRVTCAGLQARLESAGDDGRHEQVQELEAELHRARIELAALERQAAAARRLHEVLLEEYERARERLAEPVIARIRPYLTSLFPDSEVWLDEDLNLLGLKSREIEQSFEALSGGAREQLSLLVRIGLAEVVGAVEPWPLVLDDVLVNTDADRIRLVQRLLYQASRRMQIVLFTCHGPLFDELGADRRIALPPPRRTGSVESGEVVSAG